MNTRVWILAGALATGLSAAARADVPEDHDATPAPYCNQLPASAVIGVYSKTEVEGICRAMGLLDGVRVEDIREFSQASYVLGRWGYSGTSAVARQSGWESSDNQDGHFGGRGEVMIVAARR
jgi:hypothetical protein